MWCPWSRADYCQYTLYGNTLLSWSGCEYYRGPSPVTMGTLHYHGVVVNTIEDHLLLLCDYTMYP